MATVPYIKVYSESRIVLSVHTDIFSELLESTVSPGIYTYPFYFSLPPDSPATFKSSIAKVFYFIKVKCKAAYKFKKKTSISFDVSRNLDLNHLDEFLVPSFTELHKIFWDSGKLSMQLQSYTGFAPNQSISFEAMICNENKVKISRLNISLVQHIEYNVSSGYLQKEKKVQTVSYAKFKNKTKEICHIDMIIPQIPPSCNYPMIKIEYKLLVELMFSYHFTLFKKLTVTVSTVPVMHKSLIS
ncbi:arrestin domain-containing protein 5-like isoform X2 [Choristoneura fumiferana]